MDRYYYAAHISMGLSYTYDSPCWMVHAFHSRAARAAWLKDNDMDNGNTIAESITAAEARMIAPELRDHSPANAWRVVCHD